MKQCCHPTGNYKKGFWTGLLFGLIPHSFCIAFLILSLIGATGATALLGRFLLVPYLPLFLVCISLLLATLSACIYLKNTGGCSFAIAKSKWKYLLTLYTSIAVMNAIVIFIILPALSNAQVKADNEVPVFCPAHPTQKIN
jgi:hypothetical protein